MRFIETMATVRLLWKTFRFAERAKSTDFAYLWYGFYYNSIGNFVANDSEMMSIL